MGSINNFITIRGARVHNLKNIDLAIPRRNLVVITGVSGSGKSSLAFDTIYAEGQRRYVESLSSYARQFLGRMNKPEVDFISGIPPAIAIEQKVNTRNPRSTVGTSTEIYDYMRLLYSRIGRTFSPVSGKEVKKHSADDIVSFLTSVKEGATILIMAPVTVPVGIDITEYLTFLIKQGITRLKLNNKVIRIDPLTPPAEIKSKTLLNIIIDRMPAGHSEEYLSRYADSAETALTMGKGYCNIEILDNSDTGKIEQFSNRFEKDGIEFEELTEHHFSFNNPLGACPVCEGYSKIIGIDEELVVPNSDLSVYEDAIVCWRGEKMKKWKERLINSAYKFDFPVHKPWNKLSDEQRQLVWSGNNYFYGLNRFFEYLEEKKYKIQFRVMLSRYRGKTVCPECKGHRLRKEAGYVKVCGHPIYELTAMPIGNLFQFFKKIKLNKHDSEVANRIVREITSRLEFLTNVGLTYLTLDRLSSTLSGGESQRINLATSLGSSLIGSLYILDEPSIGLHPRDTMLLIKSLENLRDIGNTVIVVEHDEEIMLSADEIIDIGPEAGRFGGEVVFHGSPTEIINSECLTGKYLSGKLEVPLPSSRRVWNSYIGIRGAKENNLKEIDVKFPLHTLTAVTGVSGSGKSTLVTSILYPAVKNSTGGSGPKPGRFKEIYGDFKSLTSVEMVDQNPIGKSSRSNPVTYLKAYDEIRKLFAEQQGAKQGGYTASHFSFNIDGGRCNECQGEGVIKVEMQFMADVELECEVCKGERFKKDILEVRYQNKNIYDVLEMTISEAIEFFSAGSGKTEERIVKKLKPLSDVGLGYVKLGQSSSTLSGGESQRVKLAFYLSHEKAGEHILFIFDEPTTGLHFHDINKLLISLNSLIEKGHSVVVIEHNPEIIKSADWVIDLGPEGGEEGGRVIFEGTPEEIAGHKASYTGKYIQKKVR